MSGKVIEIRDNGDVALKCQIESEISIVTISREAFEDCDDAVVGKYSDLTASQKEEVIANLLVWLCQEESQAKLLSRYTITGEQLNQLLGE